MKSVTKLSVQKGNKKNVDVYLDNVFCCTLLLETAIKNNIKVGTIIDEIKLENIKNESEKQTAYQMATKLVSSRIKTQKEIEKYLLGKGYSFPVIYHVVEKLNNYHMIDDKQYATNFVNTHKNIYGTLKLKNILLTKGVSENIVDEVLNQDFDQSEEIERLAQKYMKLKEETKENYVKLFKYLLGKGFEYEEIKRVIKKEVE